MTSSITPLNFRRILICADGSNAIGMGHVVRSLVLARELADLGAEVEVWGSSVEVGKSLARSFTDVKVREKPMSNERTSQFLSIKEFNPELLVADGYRFSREFFQNLDQAGIDYGVIDDNGETRATRPSFVINQNPSAAKSGYEQRFPDSDLLLGLDFSLIRQEMRVCDEGEPAIKPEKVLVSLGGSDPLGLTGEVLNSLAPFVNKLEVAIGPKVRFSRSSLHEFGKQARIVKPSKLPTALCQSDLCFLAAGSTLWEANSMGKKVIALIIADNQSNPARAAAELGIVSEVIDLRGAKHSNAYKQELVHSLLKAIGAPAPPVLVNPWGAKKVATRLLGLQNSTHNSGTG